MDPKEWIQRNGSEGMDPKEWIQGMDPKEWIQGMDPKEWIRRNGSKEWIRRNGSEVIDSKEETDPKKLRSYYGASGTTATNKLF